MSAHGSDSSQGSHALESLAFYALGTFYPFGPAIINGIASGTIFTLGKEIPHFYAKANISWLPPKITFDEGVRGDVIDTAVHIGTLLAAAGIHFLLG